MRVPCIGAIAENGNEHETHRHARQVVGGRYSRPVHRARADRGGKAYRRVRIHLLEAPRIRREHLPGTPRRGGGTTILYRAADVRTGSVSHRKRTSMAIN